MKVITLVALLTGLTATLSNAGYESYIELRADLASENLCIKEHIASGYERRNIRTTRGTCYVEMN